LKNNNNDFKDTKQADDRHNPLVKLTIEKDDKKPITTAHAKSSKALLNNESAYQHQEDLDLVFNPIKSINNEKRIISKQVEVVTKIVYTYEDGSTREVIEKNNHTYHFD